MTNNRTNISAAIPQVGRIHGKPPFTTVVLHGGPGAPGSAGGLARGLAVDGRGVLEPWQIAASVEGQIEELRSVIAEQSDAPVNLIGHSWGAMLAFMFTGRHPSLVKTLILVGSGPFEERYAANILDTRMSRLTEEERREAAEIVERMKAGTVDGDNATLSRMADLFTKSDDYDVEAEDEEITLQYDTHCTVWREAKELRSSGRMLAMGREIACPVVAIHGDYDSHPPAGIQEPLSRVLKDFRFILLDNCGHRPWVEMQARDEFYRHLDQLLE